MPTYSFECRKCGKQFLEILSFQEYEEGKGKCRSAAAGMSSSSWKVSTPRVEEIVGGGSVEEFSGRDVARLRIMSEFVDGFESLRNVGPLFPGAPAPSGTTGPTRRR